MYKFVCLISAISVFYISCQKKVEGCKSEIARNFNPEADTDCCCEYYQLQLETRPFAQDTFRAFLATDSFVDAGGNWYKIAKANLLISAVQLKNAQTNTAYQTADNISLQLNNGTKFETVNDFVRLNPNGFVYTLGKFTQTGDYDSLLFVVGLKPEYASLAPASVTDISHPLSRYNTVNLYDSLAQNYDYQQFTIILPAYRDTMLIQIKDTTQVRIPKISQAIWRTDTRVGLDILYANLFIGINFRNDSPALIRDKIRANTAAIFR